jgi:hypothetical protein
MDQEELDMRCPHCDNALVTIVQDGPRVWIGFAGIRTLQVTVQPPPRRAGPPPHRHFGPLPELDHFRQGRGAIA